VDNISSAIFRKGAENEDFQSITGKGENVLVNSNLSENQLVPLVVNPQTGNAVYG
jgi:hypothetical protein